MIGDSDDVVAQPMASVEEVFAAVLPLGAAAIPLSDSRVQSLRIAIAAGARPAAIKAIACANRCARKASIVIPAVRYESLSRGRGWCRSGRGDSAIWGERVDGGYRVGEGRWTVYGTDGFRREDRVEWRVEHVRVGEMVWTVAS